jgi:hypothetical protein
LADYGSQARLVVSGHTFWDNGLRFNWRILFEVWGKGIDERYNISVHIFAKKSDLFRLLIKEPIAKKLVISSEVCGFHMTGLYWRIVEVNKNPQEVFSLLGIF